MPKIIFQDIKKNKTIRDVKKETISSSPRSKIQTKPKMHFIDEDIAHIQKDVEVFENFSKVRKGPKYTLWIIAVLCIGGMLFALSFLFTKASTTINPKTVDAVINQTLNANKEDVDGELVFSIISIDGEEKTEIEAGIQKDVSVPAKGVVVLYNNFSSSPQRLDINTRLEGSNGKVYKTEKAVVIPGIINNKIGSAEVNIYATDLGEASNSKPLDFKIVGFKGSSKYTKIYGRSKGDISGGLVGKFYVLSDIEKQGAISELKAKLEESLYKKSTDQIPDGYILYKNAIFFSANEQGIPSTSPEATVPVSVTGNLYGFLINEKLLLNKIANNVIPEYKNEDIFSTNIRDLDFNIDNKDLVNKDVKSFSFTLKGETKFIYRIDEKKILADLVNKNKKYFNQILSEYQNIESANLELFPPWMSILPKDESKIKVIVNYPK